jgi:hypothetical protein
MNEEDEAFNDIERRSKVKQTLIVHPSKEAMLIAEVAVLTEMVRVLSDKVAELEQRTWVHLTNQEHDEIAIESGCMSADWVFYGAAVERKVREKNS